MEAVLPKIKTKVRRKPKKPWSGRTKFWLALTAFMAIATLTDIAEMVAGVPSEHIFFIKVPVMVRLAWDTGWTGLYWRWFQQSRDADNR